jgi:nitroreductase
MSIKDLLKANRSYRRFYQEIEISNFLLQEWIENTRFCASGRNLQGLKYSYFNHPKDNQKIFDTLSWAGYLKEWNGPDEGERPSAYILMFQDKLVSEHLFCDDGIAAQSILLSAVEAGFGGCMIASVKKNVLYDYLNIPGNLDLLMIIALGKPKEEIVITEVEEGNIKYYRDESQIHYVPKRNLNEILVSIQSLRTAK